MGNEKRLVLELCKCNSYNMDTLTKLLSEDIDYAFALGQIIFHRMGGCAYYILEKAGLISSLNREFRNPLKSIFRDNLHIQKDYMEGLNQLSFIMSEIQIPYAVLKGGYLATIYPEGLRTSNDYDLLIQKKNVPELSEHLKVRGFKQGLVKGDRFYPAERKQIINAMINRGETIPFVKETGMDFFPYLEIDLNFSLGYHGLEGNGILDQMLTRKGQIIPGVDNELFTLQREDFLIHLCFHLYKEASVYQWVRMGRDLSLYKFTDILMLLQMWMNEKSLIILMERIMSYGAEKECYYAFNYTKQLFSIDNMLLNNLLEMIKPKDTAYVKQIYNPEEDKLYIYEDNIRDWIFNPYRNRCLSSY